MRVAQLPPDSTHDRLSLGTQAKNKKIGNVLVCVCVWECRTAHAGKKQCCAGQISPDALPPVGFRVGEEWADRWGKVGRAASTGWP